MSMTKPIHKVTEKNKKTAEEQKKSGTNKDEMREIGGFADSKLPEPTRYGDWEVRGRCSDF